MEQIKSAIKALCNNTLCDFKLEWLEDFIIRIKNTLKKEPIDLVVIKNCVPKKEVTVLYDPSDLMSFFSAAAFSGRNESTGILFNIVPTTGVVYSGVERIIGVGVSLPKSGSFKEIADANNCELSEISPPNDAELDANGDIVHGTSLFEASVSRFEEPGTVVKSLACAIRRFHSPDATPQELVYLFQNFLKAKEAIETGTVFTPLSFSFEFGSKESERFKRGKDWKEYLTFIRSIRRKLHNNNQTLSLSVKGETLKYCCTSVPMEDFPWALRIIKPAHKKYLNVAASAANFRFKSNLGEDVNFRLLENFRSVSIL